MEGVVTMANTPTENGMRPELSNQIKRKNRIEEKHNVANKKAKTWLKLIDKREKKRRSQEREKGTNGVVGKRAVFSSGLG